jgi:hypothetical protein
MTAIDYDELVERQIERIRAVEDLLAGGAYYADDDECHPMYPQLVAARQILTTQIAALHAEIADRDARLAEAVGTMELARQRMEAFARDNIGIRHGACPKYGEQELRHQIRKIDVFLAKHEPNP